MIPLQITCIVSAIDPALGRLDYGSLSDQALMEIIVDGFPESKEKNGNFTDAHGGFTDACEWRNITCVDNRVTEISLVSSNLIRRSSRLRFVLHWSPVSGRHFAIFPDHSIRQYCQDVSKHLSSRTIVSRGQLIQQVSARPRTSLYWQEQFCRKL